MKTTLTFFFGLILTLSNAQWKDSFDTGLDTAWTGDRAHFLVNASKQLQLSSATAGNSILLRPLDTALSLNWNFYFKMLFAPSASNRLTVILMTDRILQDSASAYILEIGENGNNDNWKFYRKTGQVKILLTEGLVAQLAGDPAQARMWIQKNELNHWTFSVDYQGNSQYVLEQMVEDLSPLSFSKAWFGIHCFYTDTRKDKFVFDDFCAGPPVIDPIPPEIIDANVLNDHIVRLQFNENVDSTTALQTSNYLLNDSLMPDNILRYTATLYDLQFSEPFVHNQSYTLHYQNIQDLAGNKNTSSEYVFISRLISTPQPLDIVITEFMADPTPVIGLPEKEFVEIKNRSNRLLDLSQCSLTDGSVNAVLPNYFLDTNAYLILCHIRDTVQFKSFGKVLGLTSFPSLNNSGDLISFRNPTMSIIHEVIFDDTWYGDTGKSDGGYTLEMKNTGDPCSGKENWSASHHFSGGTPGAKNSLEFFSKDLNGPVWIEAIVLNEYEIKLRFNEQLSTTFKLDPGMFSIEPRRPVISAELVSPVNTELILLLGDALDPGVEYTLVFSKLKDCLENTSLSQTVKLALGVRPDYLDLVWSEVLFNPYTGGSDFVELYNRSSKIISLQNLFIKNQQWNDSWIHLNTDRNLYPETYIAVTPDPAFQRDRYFKHDSSQIIASSIPVMDDQGANLQLAYIKANHFVLVDSFTFSASWHHPFISDKEGVSLEKLDMDQLSINQNNWQSAAASYGYATPGLANSQTRDTSLRGNADRPYELSSKIISPNGDSYRDFLTIYFTLDKPAYKARLEIYDLSGIKLKSLAYRVLATNEMINWNGDDDQGVLLPVGNYILYMELLHSDGSIISYKDRITIDH